MGGQLGCGAPICKEACKPICQPIGPASVNQAATLPGLGPGVEASEAELDAWLQRQSRGRAQPYSPRQQASADAAAGASGGVGLTPATASSPTKGGPSPEEGRRDGREVAGRGPRQSQVSAGFRENFESTRKDGDETALPFRQEMSRIEEGQDYVVDDTFLRDSEQGRKLKEEGGLAYCDAKMLDAKVSKIAAWGTVVRGVMEADGWLKVGQLYLPLTMYRVPVIRSAAALTKPLQVTVVAAYRLRRADWLGSSDPYCQVKVPGRATARAQTKVVWNSVAPVWDESFELPGFRPGDHLEFTVWDKDKGKNDDLLGRAHLESSKFYPNGFEGELPLLDSGADNAVIRVRVLPHATVTLALSRGQTRCVPFITEALHSDGQPAA